MTNREADGASGQTSRRDAADGCGNRVLPALTDAEAFVEGLADEVAGILVDAERGMKRIGQSACDPRKLC